MLLYAMHCCISEYATYIYMYVLSYISVYHICHLYSTTCCCMLLDRILYDYILSFYIITFLNIIIHCPILYEYTLVSVISYHEIISYIYVYIWKHAQLIVIFQFHEQNLAAWDLRSHGTQK